MSEETTETTETAGTGEAAAAAAGQGGGSDGGLAFMSGLSDDNKTFFTSKGFTSANEAFDSLRNLEKALGQKRLAMPDLSKPESLKDWEGWKTLGVPDTPDGYTIDRPQLSEGLAWDENFEKKAREWGVMGKVPPHVMQGFVDLFAAHINGQMEATGAAAQAQRDELVNTLKKEWGGEYNNRMAIAGLAVKHYAGELGEDGTQRLEDALGSSGLIKFFADIGEQLVEAKVIGGGKLQLGLTADGAKAELQKKRNDPGFMAQYRDKTHPHHRAAVEEMNRLQAVAHGETAA